MDYISTKPKLSNKQSRQIAGLFLSYWAVAVVAAVFAREVRTRVGLLSVLMQSVQIFIRLPSTLAH